MAAAVAPADFGSGSGPADPRRMIMGYTGRTPYVDSRGKEWLPGTEFVVRSGPGTDPIARTWWTEPSAENVSGTADPQLYRHGVHAPEFWVNVTVGPGVYCVRLRFAERPWSERSQSPADARFSPTARSEPAARRGRARQADCTGPST